MHFSSDEPATSSIDATQRNLSLTSTSAGFGTNTQQTSTFGTRPGFGTTPTSSGGGLFGGATAAPAITTGFGGFGATSSNATTSGFGQPSSGGLFGQPSQTGFGNTTNTTSASPFGGATNMTTGFGNSPQAGFGGAQPSSVFGSSLPVQNQGTGGTPFQAHMEKDAASNQNTAYQSITFQQPYSNYSFEELRLADYSQGRKYGNQNGQAGAFGTSTGFGSSFGSQQPVNTTTGFGGTSSGGLFGQASTPATGFGAPQQTTGFGQSNIGATGLFGQSKPTTSNLFGATPATTNQAGGGLFGSSGGSAFGQTPANGTNNTGGLFGQQPQQQKSLFGGGATTGFGSLNTGGFGQTQAGTTGNSLFGQPQNTLTGFGAGQQQQTSSPFGGFGSNQSQTQSQPQSQNVGGIFGGGGAFGTNQTQQKSLFGGTGTSLFGQNQTQQQQPQQNGGLFGANNNNNQQQGTNLFGQPKPATSNLFGGNTVNNAPLGGGLYSSLNNNNQTQQTQGTSLFGQPLNQQKPSLFGSSTTNTGLGNGLFSNLGQGTNNQLTGGNSLFGNNNQNQQSQMGNSLFGNSQQSQLQQQQPQQLTTSIMSSSPYGNEHLFASLGTPLPPVGPLATPLNSSQRPRRPAPIPQYKLNPAASVRLITPQKRSGFGFSYSSYGTPGSAASTPNGYSSSLLGSGSFGRTLNKSLSTSNLRGPVNAEDSILNLNAFSANGSRTYGSSGSMRKLKIDRSLRTDLFGGDGRIETYRSSPLKKKVSFDDDTSRKQNGESSARDAEETHSDDRESATPSAEEQGLLRSARPSRAVPRSRGPPATSEMEQLKGNELAIVPEDSPTPAAPAENFSNSAVENLRKNQADQPPGEYWMKPSKAELRKLDRKEKSKFHGLIVGREGCGTIEFGDVDLNGIDIDKICGDIVRLETRSATVYLDHAHKPPSGKGMNVPSLVTLENSWPRAKGGRLPVYERKGPKFDKHIQRLQRVSGTEFVDYVAETGQWIFRVPHFSTYTLDYNDDGDTSMLSAPPDTPTPKSTISGVHRNQVSQLSQNDTSIISITSSAQNSNPDDTFEFRKTRALPGAFGDKMALENDYHIKEDLGASANSNGSTSNGRGMSNGDSSVDEDDASAFLNHSEMAGSFPNLDGNMDIDVLKYTPKISASMKPKSILKASQHHRASFGTPPRAQPIISGNWADRLQHTLSPKKQDRHTLRDTQGSMFKERPQNIFTDLRFGNNRSSFATSIDVMNSLFGHDLGRTVGNGKKQGTDGKNFQV